MYTIEDLKDFEKHIRQNDSNNLESWIKYKRTHITKDEINKGYKGLKSIENKDGIKIIFRFYDDIDEYESDRCESYMNHLKSNHKMFWEDYGMGNIYIPEDLKLEFKPIKELFKNENIDTNN